MIVPFRHFGNTRSGKEICAYDTRDMEYICEQVKGFEEEDHFDAFCLFQFMTLRALRRYGELSDEVAKMELMGDYHQRCIGEEVITHKKKLLSLVTSIDICNYGESLVKYILLE